MVQKLKSNKCSYLKVLPPHYKSLKIHFSVLFGPSSVAISYACNSYMCKLSCGSKLTWQSHDAIVSIQQKDSSQSNSTQRDHKFATKVSLGSFPGLHAQLLSLAVRKAGRRPGRIYHVMRAAADVMFSLLTSGFVLSPSLFFPWIQFILSVQFVLRVRLLLDRSWLAYSRWRHSGTHHVIIPSRLLPAFRTASDKSWGVKAWERGQVS